jgi:uncharacterized protein
MRVLLTGATGFVGNGLGPELVRQGHQVVALVRSESQLPYPAELQLWHSPKLRDIDWVIHLAGENIAAGRWTAARKERILSSRTESTRRLLEIMKTVEGRKPQGLAAASAVGFYGNRGDEELTERSAPGEGFLAETCIAWEGAVAEARGLVPRVAILRIGMVLGRQGGAMEKILPLFKLGLGGRLGSGQQWMSWIHLEDLARIFLFALENKLDSTINAVAPYPERNRDFTAALARALKVKAILPAPSLALKLVLGEMSQLLLDSQRVRGDIPGFSFRHERMDSALAALVNVES